MPDTFRNPHRSINETEWQAIQCNAKANAMTAVAAGSDKGLTALERGYYKVLSIKHSHP